MAASKLPSWFGDLTAAAGAAAAPECVLTGVGESLAVRGASGFIRRSGFLGIELFFSAITASAHRAHKGTSSVYTRPSPPYASRRREWRTVLNLNRLQIGRAHV